MSGIIAVINHDDLVRSMGAALSASPEIQAEMQKMTDTVNGRLPGQGREPTTQIGVLDIATSLCMEALFEGSKGGVVDVIVSAHGATNGEGRKALSSIETAFFNVVGERKVR